MKNKIIFIYKWVNTYLSTTIETKVLMLIYYKTFYNNIIKNYYTI